MMKKSIFLALPLATMLAASCSSDDNIGANDGSSNGGDAYVAVSIKLPTTSGTRAYSEQFNDGSNAEYNVKDVTVLIFDSNNNFEQYYSTENGSLTAPTWNTNSDNNITTSATTVPLRVKNGSEKHVVVVLNNNKKHDFSKLVTLNDLYSTFSNEIGKDDHKSADYGSYKSDDEATDGCFFMTTSPYIDNATSKLVTYSTITPSTTADAAKTKAGTVYVERILGKVSMNKPSGTNWSNWAYTIPEGAVNGNVTSYSGAKVTIENWLLDVTNNTSYMLRNVAATDVESSGAWTKISNLIGSNQSGMKRIYWAKDFNYDTTQNTGDQATSAVKEGLFTTLAANGGASVTGDLSTPQYCFENTFDTDNMRQDRTTRVVFKAKFKPAGEKFTENANWYTIGSSTTPLTAAEFKARVEAAVKAAEVSANVKEGWEDALSGTDKKLTAGVFEGTVTDENLEKIQNQLGAIQVYKGGVCYYIGRVRHFEDAEGGWAAGSDSYTSVDLGRYGIVRNNWYQLTVNTVSQPGSPDVPVPSTDNDDVNNYYIDCTINILSWAVRTHGFDF